MLSDMPSVTAKAALGIALRIVKEERGGTESNALQKRMEEELGGLLDLADNENTNEIHKLATETLPYWQGHYKR